MSKELKYKIGDKLLVEITITEIANDEKFPYRYMMGGDSANWADESQIDKAIVRIPQPIAQQDNSIDRAQMVCTLLTALPNRGCYTKDSIFEAINAVDIIISELNKTKE